MVYNGVLRVAQGVVCLKFSVLGLEQALYTQQGLLNI